ncbi:MAG: hypothetical protein IT449_14795 [Phycisphaerales bacterium]|nr:hypothetical protein [Phycisphaerales bacterium]
MGLPHLGVAALGFVTLGLIWQPPATGSLSTVGLQFIRSTRG